MASPRPTISFLLALLVAAPIAAQVPSPVAFLGHEVGADYRLCNYTDMMRYFGAVAAASDRMKLVDIGATSYGQRMTMAVISSPQNLARLERLREISVRMAHAEGVGAADVAALCEEGRAVVWIDAGKMSGGNSSVRVTGGGGGGGGSVAVAASLTALQ